MLATSSSASPTGRSRARARPLALECRSVSPHRIEAPAPAAPAAPASPSPVPCVASGEQHPVSLSHRGSLRSVLEDDGLADAPCSPSELPVRSSHTLPSARPRVRALSALSSELSLKSENLTGFEKPESPSPFRDDFRMLPAAGVAVIFFDFDGTLTATPGDRAARRTKQLELCERAAMLGPRLKSLRADGASLGIISKSTEGTIRSALDAAELSKFFDAPLVGKAVGFEGKAGFIEDLALNGCLPRLGSTVKHGVPFSRILLVDDDLLELERCKARGIQVYAAPEEGGLQDEDFDAISEALRIPRPRSHPVRSALPGALGSARLGSAATASLGTASWNDGERRLSRCRSAVPVGQREVRLPSIGGRWNGKTRPTRILFSGDCYDCFGEDFTATSEGSRLMSQRRREQSSLSE